MNLSKRSAFTALFALFAVILATSIASIDSPPTLAPVVAGYKASPNFNGLQGESKTFKAYADTPAAAEQKAWNDANKWISSNGKQIKGWESFYIPGNPVEFTLEVVFQ